MKYTIEQINQELLDNWRCVSTEYKNLDGELEFVCQNEHHVFSSWRKIRNKQICPVCLQKDFQEQSISGVKTKKSKGDFRILALDQATKVTGYSIFNNGKLIKYGTFETGLDNEDERILAVKNWLISMIYLWKPDIIGLEGIQYQQNMGVTTFETLAELKGVLKNYCLEQGIKYEVCPTNTWRNDVGVQGRTRADKKRSMRLLAEEWYGEKVTEDEADSIGIGRYLVDTVKPNYLVSNWE